MPTPAVQTAIYSFITLSKNEDHGLQIADHHIPSHRESWRRHD